MLYVLSNRGGGWDGAGRDLKGSDPRGAGGERQGDILTTGAVTDPLNYMPGPPLSGRVLKLIEKKWGTHPPGGLRRLTIGELRRIASFPDDFVFEGSWGKAWERIGNAVPPRFMEAIARHVVGELERV